MRASDMSVPSYGQMAVCLGCTVQQIADQEALCLLDLMRDRDAVRRKGRPIRGYSEAVLDAYIETRISRRERERAAGTFVDRGCHHA
jgi:hypothetical protein